MGATPASPPPPTPPTPPPPLAERHAELSIATFNCGLMQFKLFGKTKIPYISEVFENPPNVDARRANMFDVIAKKIREHDVDVVAFQEVWHATADLAAVLSDRLGFYIFPCPQWGLMLASKYKIVATDKQKMKVVMPIETVLGRLGAMGRGVQGIRVQVDAPPGVDTPYYFADVFNTHITSGGVLDLEGSGSLTREIKKTQTMQAVAFARSCRHLWDGEAPERIAAGSFLLGDFNATVEELTMALPGTICPWYHKENREKTSRQVANIVSTLDVWLHNAGNANPHALSSWDSRNALVSNGFYEHASSQTHRPSHVFMIPTLADKAACRCPHLDCCNLHSIPRYERCTDAKIEKMLLQISPEAAASDHYAILTKQRFVF